MLHSFVHSFQEVIIHIIQVASTYAIYGKGLRREEWKESTCLMDITVHFTRILQNLKTDTELSASLLFLKLTLSDSLQMQIFMPSGLVISLLFLNLLKSYGMKLQQLSQCNRNWKEEKSTENSEESKSPTTTRWHFSPLS